MSDSNYWRDDFDLNDLLHPAQAFESPSEVVSDPDLTLNEKRAILAAWASDACALEAMPEIRSQAGRTAKYYEIMEALRQFDRQRPDGTVARAAKKVRWSHIIKRRGGGDDNDRGRAA